MAKPKKDDYKNEHEEAEKLEHVGTYEDKEPAPVPDGDEGKKGDQ